MQKLTIRILAMAAVLFVPTQAHSEHNVRSPTAVIFDTDMYSDIDDMMALAMLNSLQDRGEAKLLAVTTSTSGRWIAPYIDLLDTYYGHGGIPVGMGRGGITTERFNQKPFTDGPRPWMPNGVHYTQYVAQLKDASGHILYPHRLKNSDQAEDATILLRRVLAAQPDHSVVMIEVGYMGNLAKLLASNPDAASSLDGRALIAAKVRLLSIMAGSYGSGVWKEEVTPIGIQEFNIWMDIPAAQEVFSQWPTAIVASGFEVGASIRIGEREFANAFNYSAHQPVADTFYYVAPLYRAADKQPDQPHEHPVFDLTAVLFAVRPDANYFTVSSPGTISVSKDGSNQFTPDDHGRARYLIVDDAQRARIAELLTTLVTEPPRLK